MSGKTEKASLAQTEDQTGVEGTVAAAGATQGETKKVNRRGVASARGTQRLKFSHTIAAQNGLFVGHLDSVEVSTITIGENTTGMPSFNGLEIPKIVFTFASNEDDLTKRHFVPLQFTAVESNVNTIPDGKEEWKVNAIFDWFKHLLNVFVLKGREMTDAEADALSLSFEDFDEEGNYSPVEPEVVIAAWKTLFENVENILNRGNDGKPVYKTKDGKILPTWIKLVRYIKNNKKGWQAVNNGDLSLPVFVGEGCIEIMKQNVAPSIRLDIIKEAIHPMDLKDKPKSPNMVGNGIPAMGGIPGDAMGGFGGGPSFGGNDISAAAGDDIPF